MNNQTYWFIDEKNVIAEYCYIIRFNKWFKIGYTTNLITRFNSIRFSLPEECQLIGYYKTDRAAHLESFLISELTDYKSTRGEWVLADVIKFNECLLNIVETFNHNLITK